MADQMPDNPGVRRGRPQVRLGINPLAASVAVVVVTLNRIHAMLGDFSAGSWRATPTGRAPRACRERRSRPRRWQC